jgi:hypothetical protein
MKRLLATCGALGLLGLFPSCAAAGDLAQRAASGLHRAWIYVDPSARALISGADERALNARLTSRRGVPVHVVVAGGTRSPTRDAADAGALLARLRTSLGRGLTLVAFVGRQLRVDSDVYPSFAVRDATRRALRDRRGVATVLPELIKGLDPYDAANQPRVAGAEDDESPNEPMVLTLLGVLALGVVLLLLVEERPRRRLPVSPS